MIKPSIVKSVLLTQLLGQKLPPLPYYWVSVGAINCGFTGLYTAVLTGQDKAGCLQCWHASVWWNGDTDTPAFRETIRELAIDLAKQAKEPRDAD
jgi:hypothetical protein